MIHTAQMTKLLTKWAMDKHRLSHCASDQVDFNICVHSRSFAVQKRENQ